MSENACRFTAVAIDGPSGAGKSTAAKRAAKELGYIYIDTGAMYRSVALYCDRNGIDAGDPEAVKRSLPGIEIKIKNDESGGRILLNGEDVTGLIRTQEIAEKTSVVSTYAHVREKMTALQREIASRGNVVMDGRDIGSRVLPDARVKIYLDASLDARVKRRIRELEQKGLPADADTIRREIEIRDDRDTNRINSPLVQAPGSIYIDTSEMSEEEAVRRVISIIKEKI
jgi:cytidylate kinase